VAVVLFEHLIKKFLRIRDHHKNNDRNILFLFFFLTININNDEILVFLNKVSIIHSKVPRSVILKVASEEAKKKQIGNLNTMSTWHKFSLFVAAGYEICDLGCEIGIALSLL
jgi:hypothetical protein